MTEPIKDGIQARIDVDRPGFRVAHYVAVVGLERFTADGDVETAISLYYPDGQPDYVIEGLLMQGERLRDYVDEDTE